jgi:4'-phosphopantetheinyl transferase
LNAHVCLSPSRLQEAASTPAERPVVLGAREIHVWQLDLAGSCFPDSWQFLNESELRRADKFVFERDRNRFVRSRYGLRRILAFYLGIDPRQLQIILGPHDKPELDPGHMLGFNLSHCGDRGLLAVGRAAEIGVDIEAMKLPQDVRRLAQSVFSADEARALDAVADDALSVPFFTCWTRKEAYLKAIGTGLATEPKLVTVGTEPGRRRIRIQGKHDSDFVDVTTIIQDDHYIASVAVVGGHSELTLHEPAHARKMGLHL